MRFDCKIAHTKRFTSKRWLFDFEPLRKSPSRVKNSRQQRQHSRILLYKNNKSGKTESGPSQNHSLQRVLEIFALYVVQLEASFRNLKAEIYFFPFPDKIILHIYLFCACMHALLDLRSRFSSCWCCAGTETFLHLFKMCMPVSLYLSSTSSSAIRVKNILHAYKSAIE